MAGFDYSNTKVLLIGSSDFSTSDDFVAIPNIKVNLNLFKKALNDKDIIGVDEKNISISLNENKNKIIRRLRDISEEAGHKKSTLIIYYSGHGKLSSKDYELYLTTFETSLKYLEIDGININEFKKYINESVAGTKILILDCCHSGYALGLMGDSSEFIEKEFDGFEGTYIMASSPEDEPSLFPVESPELPTYFTGKLLDTIYEGLESENEYCTIEELYQKIKVDSGLEKKPAPKRRVHDNTNHFPFFKNKKYSPKIPEDEVRWAEALAKNDKSHYVVFIKNFGESQYIGAAKKKLKIIEEDEEWNLAIEKGTITALLDFLDHYPDSIRVGEGNQMIEAKLERERLHQEAILEKQRIEEKRLDEEKASKIKRDEENLLKQEENRKQAEVEKEKKLHTATQLKKTKDEENKKKQTELERLELEEESRQKEKKLAIEKKDQKNAPADEVNNEVSGQLLFYSDVFTCLNLFAPQLKKINSQTVNNQEYIYNLKFNYPERSSSLWWGLVWLFLLACVFIKMYVYPQMPVLSWILVFVFISFAFVQLVGSVYAIKINMQSGTVSMNPYYYNLKDIKQISVKKDIKQKLTYKIDFEKDIKSRKDNNIVAGKLFFRIDEEKRKDCDLFFKLITNYYNISPEITENGI